MQHVREHHYQRMAASPARQADVNRPKLEVAGLHRAKGMFDLGQVLVARMDRFLAGLLRRQVRDEAIAAVQPRLFSQGRRVLDER